MRPSIDPAFVWIGLGLWVLFMAIFFAHQYLKGRPQRQTMTRLNKSVDDRKKKEPYIPPLELDIQDTWIKCEVGEELRQKAQYQYEARTMHFSFFDTNGTQVHANSYGYKEAPSYSGQLRKLLETTGFKFVKTFNYMDTVTSVYERTPEADDT